MLPSYDRVEMGPSNVVELLYNMSRKPAFTVLGAKWPPEWLLKSIFGLKTRLHLHHTVSTNYLYSNIGVESFVCFVIAFSTECSYFYQLGAQTPVSRIYSAVWVSTYHNE